VRFFASQPGAELSPAPTLNGSAGISRTVGPTPAPAVKPLKVTLIGDQGDSKVVVRSGSGKVVYAGVVSLDERQRVSATPPVRISAEDAGAVEVKVAGHNRGSLGELGGPGSRTFHRPRSAS